MFYNIMLIKAFQEMELRLAPSELEDKKCSIPMWECSFTIFLMGLITIMPQSEKTRLPYISPSSINYVFSIGSNK